VTVLDAAQVSETAIETLAENLNDSVAPLFWSERLRSSILARLPPFHGGTIHCECAVKACSNCLLPPPAYGQRVHGRSPFFRLFFNVSCLSTF